jgi:hypothetical protein
VTHHDQALAGSRSPHFVARWSPAFPELKGQAIADDGNIAFFQQGPK